MGWVDPLLGRRWLIPRQLVKTVIGEDLGIMDGNVRVLLEARAILIEPDEGTKGKQVDQWQE